MTEASGLRRAILGLSLLGFLFFAAAFALSFMDPLLIERAAREVVRIEVERRVGEKIDALSSSRLAGLAKHALQGTDLDIERTQRAIRDEVPRKVANVIADMLKADCECRRRLVDSMQKAEKTRLSSLAQAREQLAGMIESAYASVSSSLMRELRIFTASNAAAFALLGLVAFFRGKAALQLILPAMALVGAVAVAAGLYLFNQNWLHTIVFGEYVGLGYSVYLAVVASMLADILYNRARVTTHLVNLVFSAVGSAALAVPC